MTKDVIYPEEFKEQATKKLVDGYEKWRKNKEKIREEQREKLRAEIEKFYEDETA